MDLAEIRKKARKDKEGAGRREGAVPRGSSSIQGAPPFEEADLAPAAAPAPADEPGGDVEARSGDPLEALFRFRPEMDLATEESYLRGLMEKGEEAEEGQRQYLTFSLGDEDYALDIGFIREIIKPREITDLPRVPDFVLGIISLRGVIIPVFDLQRRLRLGKVDIGATTRIIVCHKGDRCAGLMVDSITQVVRLSARNIEPPPAVLSGIDRDMVEGVGRHQGRMMILLDLESVLDAELI